VLHTSLRPYPLPPQMVSPVARPVSAAARAVRARSVVKSFEAGIPGCSARVRALNHTDLDVRPGEVLGVAGTAGAGKSTLLLTLAGMLRPDSGSLTWYSDAGHPVHDLSSVEYLPPWRASFALQSLKRALATAPGLLLLDDTLASLDSISRREARVFIRELRATGVTMVIASRDASGCASLCTRLVRIRAGSLEEMK